MLLVCLPECSDSHSIQPCLWSHVVISNISMWPHHQQPHVLKRRGVTYWFYNALCTGEHGAHNGKILGVGHPPLAHVFEDFSCCWGSQWVFGVEAHIGIDASCENTKRSPKDKPYGEQKHTHECLHFRLHQTWNRSVLKHLGPLVPDYGKVGK